MLDSGLAMCYTIIDIVILMKGGVCMTLTPKHFTAVQLLFAGVPDKDICTQCNIGLATLTKWKADTDFKRALCEVATSQMGELVPEAIKALGELVKSSKEEVKLQAAVKIWQFARMDERQDLQANVKIEVEYI